MVSFNNSNQLSFNPTFGTYHVPFLVTWIRGFEQYSIDNIWDMSFSYSTINALKWEQQPCVVKTFVVNTTSKFETHIFLIRPYAGRKSWELPIQMRSFNLYLIPFIWTTSKKITIEPLKTSKVNRRLLSKSQCSIPGQPRFAMTWYFCYIL